MILAIDPGPETSGVTLDTKGVRDFHHRVPNLDVCRMIRDARLVLVEWIECYGMPVGADVFETVCWIGRFTEFCYRLNIPLSRITRREVKLTLCGSMRAKDANLRQALIDRIGPVGTKRNPGPLYGCKSHAWSALALLETYKIKQETNTWNAKPAVE